MEGGGSDRVARHCLTAQQQHTTVADVVLQAVSRVVDGYDVSTFHGLPPQAVIMQKAIAAHAQAIAPSVDQHTVAGQEERLHGVALNTANSRHCCPEQKHGNNGDSQ